MDLKLNLDDVIKRYDAAMSQRCTKEFGGPRETPVELSSDDVPGLVDEVRRLRQAVAGTSSAELYARVTDLWELAQQLYTASPDVPRGTASWGDLPQYKKNAYESQARLISEWLRDVEPWG